MHMGFNFQMDKTTFSVRSTVKKEKWRRTIIRDLINLNSQLCMKPISWTVTLTRVLVKI